MAEAKLEPEVNKIFEIIEKGENFLLSGGAGSGKTYSLVQVIKETITRKPNALVACMTFTNAAVKEIEDRVNHPNLVVTTIHDFLWDCVKSFQKELKATTIQLINDKILSSSAIDEEKIPSDFFSTLEKGIQYKEWVNLKDGIISHDEVLIVAEKMFEKYSLLCDILKDRFKFLFVDEYQDTNPLVINILLKHLKKSKKTNIIGFFGDAVQSIYDDGIGNIDDFKGDDAGLVQEIKKEQNRRNPQKIIDLANRLRTDNLKQGPSTDSNAPNMLNGSIKQGEIIFLHSENPDISQIKNFLETKFSWDFQDASGTKELNLTHNLIADKAGFRNLMDIYDKDQILAYKNRIKKHIKEKEANSSFTAMTFGEVIEALAEGKSGRELSAVKPTATMQTFIDGNGDLYKYALSFNYETFAKFYVDKDQLLDDKKQTQDDNNKKGSKRDDLIKHLMKIQRCISLYLSSDYNGFLHTSDFSGQFKKVSDKRRLKDNVETLVLAQGKKVSEVIELANELGIVLIDDRLSDFKQKNEYLYERVKDIQYTDFQKLYHYLEGNTPFSTQHKTKGSEFDNVLVILDNGNWNSYNFENLFLESGTPSVLGRTQKIFYVCCTRAKEKLAVYYHNPSKDVIAKATEWFGKDNIYQV